MSQSQRPVCVEMGDRSGALEHVDHQTGVSEPPVGVGPCARRAKRARSPQPGHVDVSAAELSTNGELADQTTAWAQTPRDLRHRGGRLRDTVQPVEAHAQIEPAIVERHVFDAALDQGGPIAMFGRNSAAGKLQHRRRNVQAHVADVLIGSQPTHRDPATTRHIENLCTARHVADHVHRAINTINVSTHHKTAKPASGRLLAHRPVIRRPHGLRECRTLPNPTHIGHSAQPNHSENSKRGIAPSLMPRTLRTVANASSTLSSGQMMVDENFWQLMGAMALLEYLRLPASWRPVDPDALVLVGTAAGRLAERGAGRLLGLPLLGALAEVVEHTHHGDRAVRALVRPVCRSVGRVCGLCDADRDTLTATVANAVYTTPLTTAVGFLPSLKSYDAYGVLPTITARTTVISGGADLLTPPAHARDLADGIDGATHRHLPAAGHMLLHEAPHVVANEIARTITIATSASHQDVSGEAVLTAGALAVAQ